MGYKLSMLAYFASWSLILLPYICSAISLLIVSRVTTRQWVRVAVGSAPAVLGLFYQEFFVTRKFVNLMGPVKVLSVLTPPETYYAVTRLSGFIGALLGASFLVYLGISIWRYQRNR